MNEIKIFENEKFGNVRAVEIDGEPWFVGKDVAIALGFKNPRQALASNVDNEDRGVHQVDTPFGTQQMTIINESGVYSMVFKSQIPGAKEFKRWVTSEVLPSIRKYGAYVAPETIEQIMSNPDFGIRLLTELKNAKQKIALDEPKVTFANCVLDFDNTIQIGELAKILRQNGVNIGRNRLFEELREMGHLMKVNGESHNQPTQVAIEKDLIRITKMVNGKPYVTTTPKVTARGQMYYVNHFINKYTAQNQLAVI